MADVGCRARMGYLCKLALGKVSVWITKILINTGVILHLQRASLRACAMRTCLSSTLYMHNQIRTCAVCSNMYLTWWFSDEFITRNFYRVTVKIDQLIGLPLGLHIKWPWSRRRIT